VNGRGGTCKIIYFVYFNIKGLTNIVPERIVDLTGSSSKLVFKKLPEDDPRRRKPDITLAQDKLSWESVVNLESGLVNTINYFKKIIN